MKLFLIVLCSLGISTLLAQDSYQITESQMVIKGTSNMHNWESKVNEVRATCALKVKGSSIQSLSSLSVEIPVKSIVSARGSIMDGKTYTALKANEYPNISFNLTRVNKLEKAGNEYQIEASGVLNIAGKARETLLTVTGWVDEKGLTVFKGSKKINLTEFDIKPPTALYGALTTGEEVEIVFEVKMKVNAL